MDTTIKALSKPFQYPLKYGYGSVGEVLELGPGIDHSWQGRPIFCFHPHESHYTAKIEEILTMRMARDLSSRILFLHQGLVEAEGPPDLIFGASGSERLRQFLSHSQAA